MNENPIDAVEVLQPVRDIAHMTAEFYRELLDEGFTEVEALTLTGKWIFGFCSGGRAK